MRGIRRQSVQRILLIIIICTSFTNLNFEKTESTTYYFTLDGITSGGGSRVDSFYLIREHLAQAGILLKIRNLYWADYIGEVIGFYNFDIACHALHGGRADPSVAEVLCSENGIWNIAGYETSMDWDDDLGTGINEWYIEEGEKIIPLYSDERIQHYWEWQDYLMKEICPILPMSSPVTFTAYWSNLEGYNATDGILQSWGKMSWAGLHDGQLSVEEIVVTDNEWEDLNPLRLYYDPGKFIAEACLDPLIWQDSDNSFHPHLAESIIHLNDTHIRIKIREGIKWAADPDGNFTNEYLDVHDVYFTLHIWDRFTSGTRILPWIKEMRKIDDFTLDIFIDDDSGTPENEPTTRYLQDLPILIVPEYYLNQSQQLDGKTPDFSHGAWEKYSNHCFGTGLFEIADFTVGKETILTIRPDSWRLNTTLTSDPELDWNNRFGDFSGGINQLRIRMIPDLHASIHEFEIGKVDIEYVSWNKNKEREFELDSRIELQGDIGYSFSYLVFNMRVNRRLTGSRNPCPNDSSMTIGLAIRKAINHAVNRDEINDVIHEGKYYMYHSPFPPSMGIWVNPNIVKYDYSPCKTKDYLFKAGYGEIGCTPTTEITNSIFSIITTSMIVVVFILYKRRKKMKVK